MPISEAIMEKDGITNQAIGIWEDIEGKNNNE
jgi:hypothetical protein